MSHSRSVVRSETSEFAVLDTSNCSVLIICHQLRKCEVRRRLIVALSVRRLLLVEIGIACDSSERREIHGNLSDLGPETVVFYLELITNVNQLLALRLPHLSHGALIFLK